MHAGFWLVRCMQCVPNLLPTGLRRMEATLARIGQRGPPSSWSTPRMLRLKEHAAQRSVDGTKASGTDGIVRFPKTLTRTTLGSLVVSANNRTV